MKKSSYNVAMDSIYIKYVKYLPKRRLFDSSVQIQLQEMILEIAYSAIESLVIVSSAIVS